MVKECEGLGLSLLLEMCNEECSERPVPENWRKTMIVL